MGCLCNFAQTRIEASPPSKWWVCQRDNSAVGNEATHRRRGRLILRRFPGDSRSGLVNILARWARGLVCFEQMIRECHTHGRLHVPLEWISTDRAVFQLASVDQMRICSVQCISCAFFVMPIVYAVRAGINALWKSNCTTT